MGILFARVGQHRVAAGEFATELTLDPGNTEAGRALGLSLASIGDTARAIKQLELLTRRDPRDEASWQALGFAYGAANRNADAERVLRRALQLEPKDADAWRDLGALYANTGRGKAARDAYLKAIELDQSDARVFVNLGNLERRDNHGDAALAAYHQAELRDSTLGFAYRGQVDVLLELKRDADAGAVYRRWLKAMPDESNARVEAMALFTRLGRTDVALELGRDGVRRENRSGEAHLALGMAYHSAGQERDALDEMRRGQMLLKKPEQRGRVEKMIAGLRAAAPDSLRALFAADSVAHMRPVTADSAAVNGAKQP
jgi:tetratricopeptide (TPR) repeat protein